MTDNVPDFPLDHLALMGQADAAALIIQKQVYSFKELNLRIGRLAFLLKAAGLQKGDRVAAWTAKGLIACIMPLAAVRAGYIYVPINPLLKTPQLAHIMADSGAKLLITNAARAKSLGEGDLSADVRIWDEANITAQLDPDDAPYLDPLDTDFDTQQLAAILYTSGSTGRPKGVMLSHRNLTLGAVSVASYLKLQPDDRLLAVLPLSFDYGQNQLLSAWRAGACAVPLDYLTPRDVIKACARHQITTLAAVPPLWVQLTEMVWPSEATAAMRRLTNSGGALTPVLVRELRRIFGGKTDIYAMYGLTEAFRSTYLDPALIDDNPVSMGRAIPFAEIMVVRADGSAAGPDEQGELVHAGPLVAQGYWQDAERTAERFKPAPDFSVHGGMAVYSGDTVRRDRDGLLYFVGRDDAMIKTSGNRVSPTEIEEAAVQSGIIAEACALGRKDVRLGEAIILFVRAVNGQAGEAALRSHMKAVLPNFMQPAEIIWLDVFPKNANGKLDRTALQSRL
ncbi:acyl-CoA ligase (AMP-forming), exosortase A system-associated [Sphingorhabdus arenilitoris]|uniref:Acyl-CoA ligase (AMP-forming), exosortase A system-associated n=1 Tax=Sphingorhabdus arenilitoris TaxID=1490041 RepID=A0ABV8RHU7_9SPHN